MATSKDGERRTKAEDRRSESERRKDQEPIEHADRRKDDRRTGERRSS